MAAFIPATLRALGDLAVTSGNVPVGNGTTWVAQSGATLRTSLGLGTANLVQFANVGVGVAPTAPYAIRANTTLSGATIPQGLLFQMTIGSGATGGARGTNVDLTTAAASFTCPLMVFYETNNPTIGAGSSLTAAYGFRAVNMTTPGSTYGFVSELNASSARWGFYGVGTANHLSNGAWIFGQMTAPTPGSNQGAIYAKDNAGTAEIYVKDEANNETQISPHPRSVMDLHKSRMTTLGLTPLKCTWGYESTNDILGVTTSVDMGMVVRCVEWLMNRASKPVSLIKETTFSPTVKWEDRHSAESAKYVSDVAAYRKALAELVARPVPLRPDCATPPEWTGKAPVAKPKPAWMGA